MNLILFGFKNSGKTYFGKLLAEELNLPYIDTDVLIERLSGIPCSRLYQMVGEEAFRKIEMEAIEGLKLTSDTIIGVGGGAVLSKETLSMLKNMGRLVYLDVNKETLKERMLAQSSLPAYIDPLDKEGSFEAMHARRLPLYESIPATRINVSGKSNQMVIQELKEVYYGK